MSNTADTQHLTQTQLAGHLAWCELVALRMEIRNGNTLSKAQNSLFLTRWLSIALKQLRFQRDTGKNVEWLLFGKFKQNNLM